MFYDHERKEKADVARVYCACLPPLEARLWSRVDDYLRGRRLDPAVAAANHWYGSTRAGDSAPRVVIPATSGIDGNLYWQARRLDDSSEAVSRWQSPRATRGDAVIAVWPDVDVIRHAAVVEGPMDALAAAGCGLLGIALMGAAPPEAVLALTAALVRDKIVFVTVDEDAVNSGAWTYRRLLELGVNARLRRAYPAKDLAELDPVLRRRVLA